MFSQLLITLLSHEAGFYGALMSELDATSQAMHVQSHSHRVWILEPGLLCHLIPPFCVS